MIPFTKMHGALNDFIVIDARSISRNWPLLTKAMCDRHAGIGGDGVILAVTTNTNADIRMRIFNPDGSEAEMCGNGIRCLVKFTLERGIVHSIGDVRVDTLTGIRTVLPIFDNGRIVRARVDMGEPGFDPDDIPMTIPTNKRSDPSLYDVVKDYRMKIEGHNLSLTCLSMGNPHAVAFIDQPVSSFPLEIVGPAVEHNAIFPNRVNFEIVNIQSYDSVRARVWERGVGETMACGSGASAIAVASYSNGLTGQKVKIWLPGGTLNVTWHGKGPVLLEGPVVQVAEGEWPE